MLDGSRLIQRSGKRSMIVVIMRLAFPSWPWLGPGSLIAAGLTLLMVCLAPLVKMGADLSAPRSVRPYLFTTGEGRVAVPATAFRDNPTAVVFGSTRCGAPCAMTLRRLSDALEMLGNEGDRLNVLFVSTDPSRDTPAVLKDYLAPHDRRIVGLTSATGATEALADAYFRRFASSPVEQARLRDDHRTLVFLLEKDSELMGVLDARGSPEILPQKVAELIAAD